ncbi:MAG: hypothetical protein JNK64_03375 [Myxococcales bacterium]|nr:hypothetical protein [Myxococcales bacterium]
MRTAVVLALSAVACNQVFGLDPVAGPDGGPPAIDAPPPVVDQIVAGADHTCARIGTQVRCWGAGGAGQLGTGAMDDIALAADAPVVDVGPVADLVAGADHTCARLTDGTVACWGAGGNGRLGYGDINNVGDNEPPRQAGTVDLGGGMVGALAAGAAHTCAAVPGIAMRCWGAASDGRLGNNATQDVGDNETPAMSIAIAGTGGVQVVAAGGAHTCFVDGSGMVRCFGLGTSGQLGYASATSLPAPAGMVMVGAAVQSVVAGAAHTCAIQVDDRVRCWGRGLDGRLGTGATSDIGVVNTPGDHAPIDLGGTVQVLAAGDRHTCAVLEGGGVVCWGANERGQLGYGDETPVGGSGPPAAAGLVPLPGPARAITAGGDHTCALLIGGAVVCWGANDRGQLGYGDREDRGDDEPVGGVVPL